MQSKTRKRSSIGDAVVPDNVNASKRSRMFDNDILPFVDLTK